MFFWRKSYSGTCMLSGRCGGSCGWLSRFNFECTAKIWMSRWMWSWYAWATMAAWILLGIHPYQSKVSVMPFQFRWLEVFGHCTSSLNFCVRIVFSQIFVVSLRSDFCVWNPSTSIDCGIGIARWTKPPLIHEAAGIIRPCSLLRLLVFDLGRLVGPMEVGQPEVKMDTVLSEVEGWNRSAVIRWRTERRRIRWNGWWNGRREQVVNPLHSRLVFGKLPCTLQLTVRSRKGKY